MAEWALRPPYNFCLAASPDAYDELFHEKQIGMAGPGSIESVCEG